MPGHDTMGVRRKRRTVRLLVGNLKHIKNVGPSVARSGRERI